MALWRDSVFLHQKQPVTFYKLLVPNPHLASLCLKFLNSLEGQTYMWIVRVSLWNIEVRKKNCSVNWETNIIKKSWGAVVNSGASCFLSWFILNYCIYIQHLSALITVLTNCCIIRAWLQCEVKLPSPHVHCQLSKVSVDVSFAAATSVYVWRQPRWLVGILQHLTETYFWVLGDFIS